MTSNFKPLDLFTFTILKHCDKFNGVLSNHNLCLYLYVNNILIAVLIVVIYC